MTSPATPQRMPWTAVVVALLLAVCGAVLHGTAFAVGASSGTPGPRHTLPADSDQPLPTPSLGPQPRFDDGGRLVDVPGVPYTFVIPAGWALSPIDINRDARLWPKVPYVKAEIRFDGTYHIARDTDRMNDEELAVYTRTAVEIWAPEQPHIAYHRTADGSRAYRFPFRDSRVGEHYYTLIFRGRTALVVVTGVGTEPNPDLIRAVQKANDAAIASVRFR